MGAFAVGAVAVGAFAAFLAADPEVRAPCPLDDVWDVGAAVSALAVASVPVEPVAGAAAGARAPHWSATEAKS